MTHSSSNRRAAVNNEPLFTAKHAGLNVSHQCAKCRQSFLTGNDLQTHLRDSCYPEEVRKNIAKLVQHIGDSRQRKQIEDILWKHKQIFDSAPSIINISPQTAIKTADHPPIYSKQYPASLKDQQIKTAEINKLLERRQIEESTSPWSSPVVLVKKKDKTVRFCVDYRRLNEITIKDKFPLPKIEEIFDQLSDSMFYPKLDFRSGYFQIPLAKEDRQKTAFSTRDNHYQFTVLPQGITNGPAVFQRIINQILGPARWKFALAYIDDIIIYSRTFDEHLLHLNEICDILERARFRLHPEKCEIAKTQTNYLGHELKHGEIRPSSENISGLLKTQIPTTAAEACRFNHLGNLCLRRKVNDGSSKNTQITLTKEELQSFEELKKILTSDLVLRLPNHRYPYKLQTDASDEGIGAVLLQIYPEGDHPVGYLSKKITKAQRKWSPTEQECFALMCALDKWHVYLTGVKFTWDTDHQALIHLKNKAQVNKRCERWRLKIAEYDIKINHIRGIHNAMPDYLSRSPVEDPEEDPDEIVENTTKSTQTDEEVHAIVGAVTRAQSKLQPAQQQPSSSPSVGQDLSTIFSDDNRIVPFSLEDLKRARSIMTQDLS
ncbi:unnamed protein product [Didymodactylos carnosus]|uniref:Reverse transcriptase domain-containing protein n=1 Tax=Didymodactylos carnosus TaxID=1234261 RepID=A0A8S2E5S5_9BILA|nr:unnamed protein product [Didymodactylos carnosus]CAF3839798.1 unnamed protein product [Didymodactylos carnosus]